MEPYLSTNDLAVLHTANKYKVGEVVAYKSQSLNSILLHRITDVAPNGQLTLKGDNNQQVDNDHPYPKQVIGRLDQKLDDAGTKYIWIKSTPARVVGALLIAWAFYGALINKDQRLAKKAFTEAIGSEEPPPRSRRGSSKDWKWPLSFIVLRNNKYIARYGAAFVLSALLFCASFAIPSAQDPKAQEIKYTAEAELTYSAKPKQGGELVYQSGKAETGDPLYVTLIDQVDLQFVHDLKTAGTFEGTSTYWLDAQIEGTSGWQHTLQLATPKEFDGASFSETSLLKVSDLRDLTSRIQTLTTISESRQTITLLPYVRTVGKLDGQSLDLTLDGKLEFSAERQKWNPVKASGSPEPTPLPIAEQLEQQPTLNEYGSTSTDGSVSVPPSVGERLSGEGDGPLPNALRMIGFAGGLTSLIGLATATPRRRRVAEQVNLESDIAAQVQILITQSVPEDLDSNVQVGDVEDGFDDLERKLDRLDELLPQANDNSHEVPTPEQRFGVKQDGASDNEPTTLET